MNDLEKALADTTDILLDTYLENARNAKIRADIEDIRRKAADEQRATRKILLIEAIINS